MGNGNTAVGTSGVDTTTGTVTTPTEEYTCPDG